MQAWDRTFRLGHHPNTGKPFRRAADGGCGVHTSIGVDGTRSSAARKLKRHRLLKKTKPWAAALSGISAPPGGGSGNGIPDHPDDEHDVAEPEQPWDWMDDAGDPTLPPAVAADPPVVTPANREAIAVKRAEAMRRKQAREALAASNRLKAAATKRRRIELQQQQNQRDFHEYRKHNDPFYTDSEEEEGGVADPKTEGDHGPGSNDNVSDDGGDALFDAAAAAARAISEQAEEVLGVTRGASVSDVRRAYRKAALRWHPDKNPDCTERAEEKFRQISDAYDILSDPLQRALDANDPDSEAEQCDVEPPAMDQLGQLVPMQQDQRPEDTPGWLESALEEIMEEEARHAPASDLFGAACQRRLESALAASADDADELFGDFPDVPVPTVPAAVHVDNWELDGVDPAYLAQVSEQMDQDDDNMDVPVPTTVSHVSWCTTQGCVGNCCVSAASASRAGERQRQEHRKAVATAGTKRRTIVEESPGVELTPAQVKLARLLAKVRRIDQQ